MAFITTSSYDEPFVTWHYSNEVSKIYTARDIMYPAVLSSACFNSKTDWSNSIKYGM